MYLIRLDDASDRMDVNKWNKIEQILDKFDIKPIVGIIPSNKDEEFLKYNINDSFWNKAISWQEKNWVIAQHGFEHVYKTEDSGINPIQKRSEFAGLSYEEQREKIKKGFEILKSKGLKPIIFFAPSHTFDLNTLKALKNETDINIISDTIANDIYYYEEFYFIPQQSGQVRNLPFRITTFCYHPNSMEGKDFILLENFIKEHRDNFISFDKINLKKRKLSIYDKLLRYIYFKRKK